ncbi:hypothetical protein [Massilia sp. Root335]|uniref:hypothetical protein n=1 Tax=Massilia sp. Root335 TaxID=1736517 RepID=UPI0012F63D41|nr:hypothetical protein [Massilia sp. Root335]
MRNRILGLIFPLALTLFSLGVSASESISPRGRTVILNSIDGHKVVAEFVTHEVNIRQPNTKQRLPSVPGCTYARFPCIFLDSLRIAVDGSQVAVPLSVSATLPDLMTAELRKNEQNFVLILKGGDASEGYKVIVEFDKSGIKSRRLYGPFDPDFVLEETVYHQENAADN